jgi:hypothetical protein
VVVKRVTRWVIAAAVSTAALVGALLLATGGAATAASTPGCTAESPAHGSYTSQCDFVAGGIGVNYKVSKLGAGSFAEIEDLGAPNPTTTGDPCATSPTASTPTQIFTDGSGTFSLAHSGNCVAVDVQGTGKITASSPGTSCPGRVTARRCRVRVRGR